MANDLITERQACALLQVSRSSIHNLRMKHELPYSKLGGSIRYSRASIETWFKKNEVSAGKGEELPCGNAETTHEGEE